MPKIISDLSSNAALASGNELEETENVEVTEEPSPVEHVGALIVPSDTSSIAHTLEPVLISSIKALYLDRQYQQDSLEERQWTLPYASIFVNTMFAALGDDIRLPRKVGPRISISYKCVFFFYIEHCLNLHGYSDEIKLRSTMAYGLEKKSRTYLYSNSRIDAAYTGWIEGAIPFAVLSKLVGQDESIADVRQSIVDFLNLLSRKYSRSANAAALCIPFLIIESKVVLKGPSGLREAHAQLNMYSAGVSDLAYFLGRHVVVFRVLVSQSTGEAHVSSMTLQASASGQDGKLTLGVCFVIF